MRASGNKNQRKIGKIASIGIPDKILFSKKKT